MNLVELAQRIKSRRREMKLTLEQVASRTNLTQSVLSKVENFRVTPSLPALGKIAQALGTTVSELTAGLDEQPQLVFVQQGQGKCIERDEPEVGITYKSLAHERFCKIMDPFLLEVPAGKSRQAALAHEGEEFLYLLEGQIDFEYDEELYHFTEGDCVYFNAQIAHRIINSTSEKAKVMCIFAGGGEQ
ncbi:MAG: cupin domain-containing protein [Planctomycetia bacterium]|jgi:transcriptional regulator with XRE-family HTH domain